MDRSELDRLDRDALIARAESLGVLRARVLTRPELIDEILVRTFGEGDAARSRGFFGRARDLLAKLVDRNLHLPDESGTPGKRKSGDEPMRLASTAAMPTVTLAEVYATQGHRAKAIQTLRGVLAAEPEHAVARDLLARLEDDRFEAAEESPPEDEPTGDESQAGDEAVTQTPHWMLDDAPLPPKYDVDECVAIPVDPTTMFVYWEVRESTRAHLEATRPCGSLVLRVVVIAPSWEGPRVTEWDQEVSASLGDWFVRQLEPGSVVRTAIGWNDGKVFTPIAHSPALETPANAPSPLLADVLVRWTPDGAVALQPSDADASSIARALELARAHTASDEGTAPQAPIGSSEAWRS